MAEPPTKVRRRAREACEPCRRKKGRCPGEKPVCSLCARLRQNCTYVSGVSGTQDALILEPDKPTLHAADLPTHAASAWEDTVSKLDDKLTEVLDHVRLLTTKQRQSDLRVDRIDQGCEVEQKQSEARTDSNGIGNNRSIALEAHNLHKSAELYLQFCHCQPLPLFSPTNFTAHLPSRDPGVRLCVVGLSKRFGNESAEHDANHYLKSARDIVLTTIKRGQIELSTLQCLCMLALADFNDGHRQRAGTYVTMAVELSRSANLDLFARQPGSETGEYVRTLWSIIMLQYLMGNFGIMAIVIDTSSLRYPISDGRNDLASSNKQGASNAEGAGDDLGIIAYALQMTEAWYKVRQWVHHRGKLDTQPPWSEKSIYSSILYRQMELESQMPHKHRFKPSGFAEHFITVLSTNRLYWAPWLYLQMTYHAIVCTLNHPILLSIHLRRFKVNQIPELFLQHTADMIGSHTDWVIHLLEIAREKQFEFSDPFLGQYVAIVATIFLQQSYTEDSEVRMAKQTKFSTCLKFVQDLGKYWSSVQGLAADLKTLEQNVSQAYESSSSEHLPNLSRHVDLSSFWRILDNTISEQEASRSIFGTSLRLHTGPLAETDMLSTKPIPEPTRVNSLPHPATSTATTPATVNGLRASAVQGTFTSQKVPANHYLPDNTNGSPFLAQDFFALGQDFVGNVDDWFTWDNS